MSGMGKQEKVHIVRYLFYLASSVEDAVPCLDTSRTCREAWNLQLQLQQEF